MHWHCATEHHRYGILRPAIGPYSLHRGQLGRVTNKHHFAAPACAHNRCKQLIRQHAGLVHKRHIVVTQHNFTGFVQRLGAVIALGHPQPQRRVNGTRLRLTATIQLLRDLPSDYGHSLIRWCRNKYPVVIRNQSSHQLRHHRGLAHASVATERSHCVSTSRGGHPHQLVKHRLLIIA
jgi:hypothetical protein